MSNLPLLDVDKFLEDLKLKHKAAAAAAHQSISLTDTIQRYGQKDVIQHMGKLLSDAHTNVTKLLARLNDKRKNIEQFISDSMSTKELYKFTKHEIERFFYTQ